MRYSSKLLWVVLCFAGSAWAGTPAAAPEVSIEMLAADKLKVSYTLPAGCDAIDFKQRGEVYGKVRANWRAVNACGSASQTQIKRTDTTCASVDFIVATDTGHYDRVYPYAFPMGGAIYAHSSHYALDAQCGLPAYSYQSPGFVLAKGELAKKSVLISPDTKGAEYMPALLMEKAPSQDGGAIVHIDPGMDEPTRQLLLGASNQAVAYLRAAVPDANYRRPALAAIALTDSVANRPRYVGDADDVLRLALYNWPAVSDPDAARQVRSFVAHEYAHRFQPEALFDLNEHKVLLVEGGAELLSWLAMLGNGWANQEQAADQLNGALGRCLQGVGTAAWGQLPESQRMFGKLPYDCGFALHALALAANESGGGLGRLNRYYQLQDSPSLSEFPSRFACDGENNCKAQWLPRLLGKHEPFGAVVAEMGRVTGLLRPVEPTTYMRTSWLANEFGRLMRADCNGSVSIHFEPDGYRIGATPQPCKTLREGMRIRAAEAQPFKDGQAVVALRKACSQRGSVNLTLAEGEPVSLGCKQPGPEPVFYAVDMPKLLGRLGIMPPDRLIKAR